MVADGKVGAAEFLGDGCGLESICLQASRKILCGVGFVQYRLIFELVELVNYAPQPGVVLNGPRNTSQ